jgi:hypothetical protein
MRLVFCVTFDSPELPTRGHCIRAASRLFCSVSSTPTLGTVRFAADVNPVASRKANSSIRTKTGTAD